MGVESLFHKSERNDQLELTNDFIHLNKPVVFRLYGKISPHSCEVPPIVRWDFTLPVALPSSCKLNENTKDSMGR